MAQRPGTILVVDDEFTIVETLVEILSWEGFGTATAAHGRAALDVLTAREIALVAVDFMMPVMDGVQFIRAMRENPAWAHVPVLMMSAAPMRLAGVTPIWNGLLRKPFGADEFVDAVKKLLAEKP